MKREFHARFRENVRVKFPCVTRLAIILKNPACLKVFKLQCDLFSLGKIYVYKGEDEQPDDIVLQMLANPNLMQSQSQWLWDYMFWLMLGTDYCYLDSDIAKADNVSYHLNPSMMEWPRELELMQDKLIFSTKTKSDILKNNINYRYADGTSIKIPLSKIITVTDLTNGAGNWFKGHSAIDALYKVISNSEESLDAMNVNLQMSKKFQVSGKSDPDDTTKLPLGKEEKVDIESKIMSRKHVHANKSMLDIQRFVSDIGSLQLPESYMNAYYIIGTMYNIPRDVLEAYLDKGSTYENQEKATAKHVSYSLQPKGDDLLSAIGKRLSYDAAGLQILISWDHLPFMQVMEADRQKVKKMQAETFALLLDQGVALEEVNQFLDTTFLTGKANAKPTTINNASPVNSGAN